MNDLPLSSSTPARGLSTTALVLGILSLVSAIVFVTTSAGPLPLVLGIVLGLVALIVGIIALKKGQSKAAALFGLITGALVVVLGLALVIFALLFVGAFTAGLA